MTRIGSEKEEEKKDHTAINETVTSVVITEGTKPAELPKALEFSCQICRRVLFTEDNLEEHISKIKGYNTRSHSLKVTNSPVHPFISTMVVPTPSLMMLMCMYFRR
jgi:hypothetical protein